MLGTREYTLCSPFRANAHNYSFSWFYARLDSEICDSICHLHANFVTPVMDIMFYYSVIVNVPVCYSTKYISCWGPRSKSYIIPVGLWIYVLTLFVWLYWVD